MGTTTTPKYAVDIFTRQPDGRVAKDTISWNGKQNGRANQANLEKFILAYGKSFDYGGVNFHISQAAGSIQYPHRAVLRLNKAGGAKVADWDAPMFMVW